MSEHAATIEWHRNESAFCDNQYSRGHRWIFDGGIEVAASASPHVVPVPLSNPANVDPEEAFVASVASCHMLWFLSIAAKKQFVVDSYVDNAIATMGKNSQGKLAITHIKLRPCIQFSGSTLPTEMQIHHMHELAHDNCFIANSVYTIITVEPT